MEEPPTCPSEDRTSQISLLTSDDAPWYVSLDHEDEIEYDIAENQHTLKCGTLVGLVEQLTRHDRLDASFNETFLTTFQTFVSASELFEMLIKRFNIEPPAELDESEHERWKKQKQQTIRLRVVNILKNWFERFWMEPNDEETRNFLQNAHDLISDSPTIMAMPSSLQLLAIVEQRLQGHGSIKRLVRTPTASAPLPIIPRSMKKLKLLDIDPVECARQLTIVESGLYRRIRPAECLNKRWKKKSPENPEPVTGVNATILHSNKLANWVGETILNQTTVKKRVTMIKYFVSVADQCRTFNNYATLMSIISGLGQTPVYRLRSTWRQVSKHVLATLEELRQLLESSKNFAKYREILCGTTSPCVPFLGIYLSDLTFIEDGIPNTTSSGMINFTKRRKTAKVIQEIQQYQTVPYALQPVPELQDYIICNIQAAKDVHEMYNRSLEIEPTENGEEDILGSPAVNHMSSVVIASLILR